MQTKIDFYPAKQKHGKKINVFAVIRYTVLILVGLIMLFPTVIMVTSSLKSYDEYYAVTFKFLPANVIAGFDNYARVFSTNDQMLGWIWNTVILIVTNTAICTVSTIFVAYGFAKFRSKIADVLFIVLLATMMIPWAVTMIPSFMIWARLGLTDTFIPLIIPSIGGSAYYVFMFKQNMRGIPSSIIEAAEIDGANSIIRLFKIIVPNCLPAIVTMVIFTIMGIWGDYLGPLIYLRSPEKFNISMGLNMLRTQSNQGKEDTPMLLAASVLMAVPSIILYFLGTRIFSKGISLQGGVKG
ncbi:MAG: carbohydrate ABC transporter permease [Candidatus Borkfalkiaceae bacterium]|nr:carbohydrate ABC transporter permease [Christensenellaceae bacterium]